MMWNVSALRNGGCDYVGGVGCVAARVPDLLSPLSAGYRFKSFKNRTPSLERGVFYARQMLKYDKS